MFDLRKIDQLADNAISDPAGVFKAFTTECLKDLERVQGMMQTIPAEFQITEDMTRPDFGPLDRVFAAVRNMLAAINLRVSEGQIRTLFDAGESPGRAWSDIAQGAYETYRLHKGSSMAWEFLHVDAKHAWEAAVRQAADGSAPSSWTGWKSSANYQKTLEDAEPGNIYETAHGRVVQMHAHSQQPNKFILGETIQGDCEIVKYNRDGGPVSHAFEWRIVDRRLDLEGVC